MIRVTVNTGSAPTELFKQLPAGTLIQNQDTVNAVWISSSPNVSPGNGHRLGSLGSVIWEKTGDSYACVDTGVSSAVSVIIGKDVSNPVNPVDVATSTALQLAAQGIPNTLLMDTVHYGTLEYLELDVSKYSSLLINLSPVSGGTPTCFVSFTSADYPSHFTNSYELTTVSDSYNSEITYEIPVSGPIVSIFPNIANGFIMIRGTNRLVNRFGIASRKSTLSSAFRYDGSATAATPVALPPTNTASPLRTTYRGLVHGYLSVVGNVAPAGNLTMAILKQDGTEQLINITGTSTPDVFVDGLFFNMTFNFIHPVCQAKWYYTPNVNLSSLTAQLWLTGE